VLLGLGVAEGWVSSGGGMTLLMNTWGVDASVLLGLLSSLYLAAFESLVAGISLVWC
jgi:hypothetical protein